nr:collagen alpha-1(I) chain-like [Globicephala melas]
MGRRRHGGRAIGPRLSRVTKAAGARPPAGAGGRLTGGEGAGRRRTPGPDRQPAPPAARTADRLRSGQRGVAARRRDVAAWRDEGGGKGGRPHRGSPRTSDPHPTNQSGAARNLGGPGAGPRAPAGRSGGRPARARSPALTRTGGGGGGSGRGPATPHLPARPTGAGRRGHGGRSATAGRGPDDPRSGERAGAGRGAARQGDGRRSPQPRPTRNDAGGRAAAADHGAVPRQAREAKHTGTRPGGRQTRRTGDRADEAQLARPPPRRRGDDLAEDVAGGGGRAPTRGRPGGHPKGTDASRPPGHDTGSHRQRPPAQGRSRGTQDADWPPRPPNQGAPPRGARAHHRQTPTSRGQPRDNNTLPRAHRPPHVPRHTPPPPRPTPPPQGPETLPSEATRTVPTHRPRPRLAARAGATGSSRLRDWGVGTSVRPRTPPRARHRAGHRTRTHTAPRRTPAWRDPPPTQRGEARAAVGKERHSAPPRGRRKPSREGEGLCRPRGSGSGHRGPLHAWEGQRLGGPARPPGSGRGEHAREARQTPPSRRPRPNTIAPTPVCDSPHTRKWGRRHTRRRPGHEVSPPHGTPWEDDGDEVAGPRPPPRERNRGKTPRPLPSRPPRESHSRDTPPRRRPRGARWEKGTTPPLGLAHLRDDLERSRGTTEDRASHAHAPAAGARRSGGTAPTDAGRTAREAHAKEAKRERLLRPRTTAPPTPSPGALSGPSGRPEQRGGGRVERGGAGKRGRGSERAGVTLPGSPARAGRPIRATQYDSGRSPPPPPPRPGLAVEEGAGEGEKKSRPPTGTHVGPLKGRACTPNLKRQQEAPTPGRHRDSHRQRRPAPGTLPRARRPSHSPHEGRRSSRDKGQYKSGRQVAPDNGSNVPGPGSLSPAGHRGCSSAGPPKRPSSARRGEPAGVWRGPEASVSELAPGTARHGATPAADGEGGVGGAGEAGKTSPGGRLEGNALPT